MKTKHLLLAAVLSLGASGVVLAADTPTADSKVQVNFTNPDKFTDIRDSYSPTEKGEAANIDLICRATRDTC